MQVFPRAARRLALVLPLLVLVPLPLAAQDDPQTSAPQPQWAETGEETPWLYQGSDVPRDPEWLFGTIDNGLRYAVRKNGVPPGQVSIRIRVDAGSLYETESERGFAHLMEHLSFRESKYLGPAMAIPTWQRLGASFGSDTNAETSPTQTVYKLDLPNATPAKLEESLKLLSGMIREPVLNATNVAAEVPIVLAEKRENDGAAMRLAEQTRATLFTGQPLATRLPIGTEETLRGATAQGLQAFHKRWYRPENVVISVVGDADRTSLALLVEKYFGDWRVSGASEAAPSFGDPLAPAGADPANPVGETGVAVEPDLPRSLTYAVLRPWRPVQDTIAYNQGLLIDALAQALINRRLEARARAGGSYLYAQVEQDDVSRSADATFVSFAPLDADWRGALGDVRAVIADALATPPSQAEIDREMAEFESIFVSQVEQREVLPGSRLADDIVNAVDIREAVASPETVLFVFRGMKDMITPEAVFEHTQALFRGEVIRGFYATPAVGEADAGALRAALLEAVTPDTGARLSDNPISFADLPPVGAPGTIVEQGPLGALGIERVVFANGARALVWPTDAEPGRVSVKLRFGAGRRAFAPEDAAYIGLGKAALIGSGQGELGQEELDRISTGRVLGFNFAVEDGVFTFSAQTRAADLADQLYLFASKLAMPRWDANPVLRAQAAGRLAYESYATNPGGVLTRDLDYLLSGENPNYRVADPAAIATTTPEGFRKAWAPVLAQGDVEVLVFGDFDRDAALAALSATIGALPERAPIPKTVAARTPGPVGNPPAPLLRYHRGSADQAAAVIAWPTGGGVEGLSESRQLEILSQLFNNRLIDAMRERAGASYSPQVGSSWPVDLPSGGRITAVAQLRPADVPVFFAAADGIAHDLATTPVSAEELQRVTEPLRQLISRASTGNLFWLYQLEGASNDPRRVAALRTLLPDYTRTTPAAMQALAQKYLAARPGWKLAILPEGQQLAESDGSKAEQLIGR